MILGKLSNHRISLMIAFRVWFVQLYIGSCRSQQPFLELRIHLIRYQIHILMAVLFFPILYRSSLLTNILFSPTTMTPPQQSSTTTIAAIPSKDEVDIKLEEYQQPPASSTLPLPKDFGFIPVPRYLRYDPAKPFHFGLLLNAAFGLFSTFSGSFPPFLDM